MADLLALYMFYGFHGNSHGSKKNGTLAEHTQQKIQMM
jgi:hypothetical protein